MTAEEKAERLWRQLAVSWLERKELDEHREAIASAIRAAEREAADEARSGVEVAVKELEFLRTAPANEAYQRAVETALRALKSGGSSGEGGAA